MEEKLATCQIRKLLSSYPIFLNAVLINQHQPSVYPGQSHHTSIIPAIQFAIDIFLVWNYSMNPLLSVLISPLLLMSLNWYINMCNSLRPGVRLSHSSPLFSSAVLLRQDLLSLWKDGSPFLDFPSILCTLHPCL